MVYQFMEHFLYSNCFGVYQILNLTSVIIISGCSNTKNLGTISLYNRHTNCIPIRCSQLNDICRSHGHNRVETTQIIQKPQKLLVKCTTLTLVKHQLTE
jgi:hypothetical protein